MSVLASGVTTLSPIRASDIRHVADEWTTIDLVQPSILNLTAGALGLWDWTTGWWPRPGVLVGEGGISDVITSASLARIWPNSGANGRLGYVGVTRDQYGSAVGSCTVRCFRTSTSELVSTVTSDPSTGAYVATTPYYEAHFLTVHKATAPDISGASIDTILPA